MEKREIMLYAITVFSLAAFIFIIFGAISKNSSISDNKDLSLSGNSVYNLKDNFNVGDKLTGDITIAKKESDAYGDILLAKNNKPLATNTFNLKSIPQYNMGSGYSIKIEDLMNYTFEEKGNYQLFISVSDLGINIKKKFTVE